MTFSEETSRNIEKYKKCITRLKIYTPIDYPASSVHPNEALIVRRDKMKLGNNVFLRKLTISVEIRSL